MESAAEEDSDATMAADEEPSQLQTAGVLASEEKGVEEDNVMMETAPFSSSQAVDSDSSMPCSPSILHPNEDASTPVRNQVIKDEYVSCSSEEDILSQEYPPASPLPRLPQRAAPTEPSAADSAAAITTATPQPYSALLSQIEATQASLSTEVERILGNYGDIFPVGFVKNAEAKLTGLEEKLKQVGEAHQAERKELVAVHSQLSQGRELSQGQSCSQEYLAEGGGGGDETSSLRTKLISLSARQKKLLQCFSKQKELASKVSTLSEREAKTKKRITVEASSRKSNPVQVTLPNLVKHLINIQPLPQAQPHPLPLQIQQSHPLPSHTQQPHPPPPQTQQPRPPLPQAQHPHPPSLQTQQPRPPPPQPHPHPHLETLSQSTASVSRPPPGQTDTNQDRLPTVGHAQSSQDTSVSIEQDRSSKHEDASSTKTAEPRHKDVASTKTAESRHEDASARTVESLSSSQLTQPVPLDTLIQHNILEPGPRTLTCTILGCDFVGSLLRNGSIEEARNPGSPSSPGNKGTSTSHRLPQQWVQRCWAALGHPHKKISRKQAYNKIVFRGRTLSQHCERYSRIQVSTYLKKATIRKSEGERKGLTVASTDSSLQAVGNGSCSSVASISRNTAASEDSTQSRAASIPAQPLPPSLSQPPLPPPLVGTGVSGDSDADSPNGGSNGGDGFDLNSLLMSGKVVLVSENFQSLELPPPLRSCFWAGKGKRGKGGTISPPPLPLEILRQLENDLAEW